MTHFSDVMTVLAPKLHTWLGPTMLGGYWICAPWDSQRNPFLILRCGPWADHLDEPRQRFAKELSTVLNAQVAEDGVWIVGWASWSVATASPDRLTMSFFDDDADMKFIVDSDDRWEVMRTAGATYVQQCAEAYASHLDFLRLVEIRPRDTIKVSKGQPSADPHAQPEHWLPYNMD